VEKAWGLLTQTTTQILESLRDPANGKLWTLFDQRYRPVLLDFARKRGLGEEDAAEVAQETLAQFASDYTNGRYDRTRGRLSSWIIGIASNRIADAGRDARRRRVRRGDSALDALAGQGSGDPSDDADWQESVRKVIFEKALSNLRSSSRFDERTIKAFELAALRGVPPIASAEACGMTVDEVYVAKNRVIKKLRELVAQMTLEFDAD